MTWKQIAFLLLALGAFGCTRASQAPTKVQWDDTAAQKVRMQVQKTMDAFASRDLEGFKAGLTEDVVGYDMDLESKPVKILRSRDDAGRYAEDMFAQLKTMVKSMTIDYHAIDCKATSTLAYCTVEFDFKAILLDGSTVLQPTHNSVVLRNGDDGWKWTHWHSSLAVPPAPSSPPTPERK